MTAPSLDASTIRQTWSSGSTVATLAGDDPSQDEEIGIKANKVTTRRTDPAETGENSGQQKIRAAVFLPSILCLIIFCLVAVPIVLTREDENLEYFPNAETSNNSSSSVDMDGLVQDEIFSTICDITTTYHSDQYSSNDDKISTDPIVLKDRMGRYQVWIAVDDDVGTVPDWEDFQPTESSMYSMGNRFAHIQTGSRNSSGAIDIQKPIELSLDKNWTLSFAGAQLWDGDTPNLVAMSQVTTSDILSGPDQSNCPLISYQNGGSLRLCAWGLDETTNLFMSSYRFHVITLTYSTLTKKVLIFQNTIPITEFNLDGVESSAVVSRLGSLLQEGQESPGLAIRRLTFLNQYMDPAVGDFQKYILALRS